MNGSAPAGWYPDPAEPLARIRYFDGHTWTDRVRDRPAPLAVHAPAGHTAAGNRSTRRPADGAEPAWVAEPAPGTRQALIAQQAAGWTPPARPTWAEAGWYPDPGRSRKLRFYDGDGWTARIRMPLQTQMRALPKAAIAARARLLEIADQQAVRSHEGRQWRRTAPIRVEQPQSLHRVGRRKAGRVGGTLSLATVALAAAMLMFTGWQEFGADAWQHHSQEQLAAQLAEEFDEAGETYDRQLSVSQDPTPAQVDRPTLPTSPGEITPTREPRLGDQPADITPFPPRNWNPPAGRKVRNLDGYALGEAVGRLVIPRLGLDEVMVAGIGANELAKGPGVARYAMLPGSPGNAVVAGHRTGWGEPFRHLDQLRYGDQIIVEVPGQGRVVYEVRARSIVGPTNTRVVEQTEGVRLTLTTCTPVGVNSHRMVVQAEMIEGPWLDRAVNRSAFRTVK